MPRSDQVEIVDAIVRFSYNASFEEFTAAVYTGTHEEYQLEKYHAMQRMFNAFWGGMDEGNRAAFVAAAIKRQEEVMA